MKIYKVSKKITLLSIMFVFASSNFILAQNTQCKSVCEKLNVNLLNTEGINFIVHNKSKKPKPTLIFIRGNGSIPLIIDETLAGAFPFKTDSISKNFNLVVVSKPGIPACADSIQHKYINIKKGKVHFINNNDSLPNEYVSNNNLDSLTKRINTVINYLAKQKWVNHKKIFIVGHSAGAHIAAQVAKTNSYVSKFVCLSSNPYGRFQEKIRAVRVKEIYDIVSREEANILIDSIYKEYQKVYENRFDNINTYDSDTYFSWASFTFPSLASTLLSINKPFLYVYGTGDVNRLDVDYLKLDFIQNEKQNLSIKKYPALGHNFMRTIYNEEGKAIGRNFYWNKVMRDIEDWLLEEI
ncbi:MAG: hypothetical protein ACPG4Y_05555 [Chitinophagales bacterium]